MSEPMSEERYQWLRTIKRGEYAAAIWVHECLDEIDRLRQLNKQGDTNTNYLIEAIDVVHDKLCPNLNGTWQNRVEQIKHAVGRIA